MHAQLERGFEEMIQNGNFPANSKLGIISTAINEVSNDGANCYRRLP